MYLFQFSNYLVEEERVGTCVFLRLCVGMFVCSFVCVIVSLSLGQMGWSAVPECDISWSYSLVCFSNTDTLQMQFTDNNYHENYI